MNILPDDRALWELATLGSLGGPALLVANDRGLFSALESEPLRTHELASRLGLALRPVEAIVAVLLACKLLEKNGSQVALSAAARAYLLPSSPMYFGGFLAMAAQAYQLYSFESLKGVAINGGPVMPGADSGDVFEITSQQAQMAAAFTEMMHGMSIAPSRVWPEHIDLSAHHHLLDLGGGSGVHSIAAVRAFSKLRATVLDMASVCAVAKSHVEKAGLSERISLYVGDLFNGDFPKADAHFFGSVFHDWPQAKTRALAQRSFEALPPGGRILIHEMLLADNGQGPAAVAAFSVSMLFGTEGHQYSGAELSMILREAGFSDCAITPTFGYWSIVSARKPS